MIIIYKKRFDQRMAKKDVIAIYAVLVSTLLLLAGGSLSVFAPVSAAPTSTHQPLTREEFASLLPPQLSDTDLKAVKDIAISSDAVKQAINGRPYEFMAQDFIGNVYATPVIWQPEIHINVANTTEITAVIDLASRSISSIETVPMSKIDSPSNLQAQGSGSQHSWATDYYSGSTTIDGLDVFGYAPSHSTSSTDTDEALLLNAVETGANDANLCNPTYYSTDYFAQTGFDFITGLGLTHGDYVVYTDTAYGCAGQYPSVTANIGDLWEFTITSSSSGWVLSGYDQTTGQSYSYTRTGVTYNYMINNDFNEGVFFENTNTGTSWASLFSSNPSMTSATMRPQSNHVWTNWNGDTEKDAKCTNAPVADGHSVMTGNLVSGGTTTWSMSQMASSYPAC